MIQNIRTLTFFLQSEAGCKADICRIIQDYLNADLDFAILLKLTGREESTLFGISEATFQNI